MPEVFLIAVCFTTATLRHFCFGNTNEVWQDIPHDFQGDGCIVCGELKDPVIQKFYASIFINLLKQAGIEAFAHCV